MVVLWIFLGLIGGAGIVLLVWFLSKRSRPVSLEEVKLFRYKKEFGKKKKDADVNNDLVWVREVPLDQQEAYVLAETPYDVIHVEDGAIIKTYTAQKALVRFKEASFNKFYFINTKKPCKTKWGTPLRFDYEDAETGRIVSVGAHGMFSFFISDSKKFIEKILGSDEAFTADELVQELLAKIIAEFSNVLLTTIETEKITYAQFDANLKNISESTLNRLNHAFAKYGIIFEEFIIEQFNKDEVLSKLVNERKSALERHDDEALDYDRKLVIAEKAGAVTKQMGKNVIAEADSMLHVRKSALEGKGEATYEKIRELDLLEIAKNAEAEAVIERAKHAPVSQTVNVFQEGTAKCVHCGRAISAGDVHCSQCGKPVVKLPL
ncbi:MAG: SPFH domain-containing protein [Firmicutes bacterium]|nr:SPFH domain-containing protein [Bacillota bacterium]